MPVHFPPTSASPANTATPFGQCGYFAANWYSSGMFPNRYFGDNVPVSFEDSSMTIVRNPQRNVMVDINVGSNLALTGTTLARRFGSLTQPGFQTWDRQYDFWMDGLTQFGRRPPNADYLVYGAHVAQGEVTYSGGEVVPE